ncbi:MAG: CPBP family intramembrane metalloprotease [Candidatus Electrothrix sp. ATG2]|nr:CPBP family intramembrane metalloprotease [Candidatus Electrothrix sp. ATG2]
MHISRIKAYVQANVQAGLLQAPRVLEIKVVVPCIIFSIISFCYGSYFGVFNVGLLDSGPLLILPVTLFVFPSFLEELVFRGLIIPAHAEEKGIRWKLSYIAISTLLFVGWHPLNAVTINTGAQVFFLNPHFLFIVALLGITCSYTYIHSKSLWVPVLIHWITVLVWVFALGGRNLVLE